MGQRLVITVRGFGKDLAKIYYHWSAYSISALREAKELIDCICDDYHVTEKELKLRLIRFCEANGGGIQAQQSELDYIQKMFPGETFKTDGFSRNYGLIALSEDGMADLQAWSEGDICIDIDEDIIHNEVYCWYDGIDSYNEERKEWDDEHEDMTLDDVPDIGYALEWIKFDDIDDVMHALVHADSYVVRNGNEIFEIIA